MRSIHLPVIIEQDEDDQFILSVPSLKGCHSCGKSIEEAAESIAEAAILCLRDQNVETMNRFVGVRDLVLAI